MQPSQAAAFIARIEALPPGPGVDLGPALQVSLNDEEALRKLFATDRQSEQLANPHVGLVDIFEAPAAIRTTRARITGETSAHYVMPLQEKNRRREGDPCVVSDLEDFKKNWAIFTEGSLSQVDWKNIVAAGGSVLACLAPLDAVHKVSKRAVRKHYHTNAYPTSDIDLFLWGLNAKQAEAKILSIYEAVRDSVPWDVTCIRTKHTVSIHSQYPYRSIQIVLRLYQSPAEILAGFDIDAPCCAYDGERVWAIPRAIVAMMRQCNTVDMTRRSPSYEIRLAKYAARGFEIYVPNLRRDEVDPTIFERSITRMIGLARLLVLEKLTDVDTRYAFLESRRQLRGRPNPLRRYDRNQRRLNGDLKAEDVIAGLELNNYDVASFHIPYGHKWDARRIDKHIYQTDLGMNSTFNPKNKGRRLHRHPAFFGTMEECLEDCCETCPEPVDDDERELQEKDDEQYIRGRIKFIEENPGRQTISGSFNPIDDGEWAEQVYMKPTQQLFMAIADQDRDVIKQLVAEGIDLNQRDHVGRTCLHVAIFTKSTDIACDLIDAGARISARLVDGRTPLHLAAQHDEPVVIAKLFEKNAANVAKEGAKNPEPTDDDLKKVEAKVKDRPSSEDDWSSHPDDDVEMIDADDDVDEDEGVDEGGEEDEEGGEEEDEGGEEGDEEEDADDEGEAPADSPSPPPGDIPEDEDEPDIIDINQFDFDFGFTALSFAVVFASVATIEKLLAEGADVKLPSKTSSATSDPPLHPLTLVALREDEDEACTVAECLIKAGATSTTATDKMWTIFHYIVSLNKAKLLGTILRCDEHARTMLDFPYLVWNDYVFPVVTAISKRNYATLAVMLVNDVKLELDEGDITRAQEAMSSSARPLADDTRNYLELAFQPVETALASADDIIQLLLTFGASFNIAIKASFGSYVDPSDRRTIFDWVEFALQTVNLRITNVKVEMQAAGAPSTSTPSNSAWKNAFRAYKQTRSDPAVAEKKKKDATEEGEEKLKPLLSMKQYLEEVQRLLQARNAQKWADVYPDIESTAPTRPTDVDSRYSADTLKIDESTYADMTLSYSRQLVPQHLVAQYDKLFEACFSGDDAKIQELCLPPAEDKENRPLKVAVRIVDDLFSYGSTGYTPLFAAVAGGKWATAKLILSIAAAQYRPQNPQEKKFKVSNIKLDDDDPNDDDESDADSEMTVDGEQPKFIDISSRGSSVQSPIKPADLLDVAFTYAETTEGPAYHTLLTKSIVDNDMNTFTRIANLYQGVSQPLEKTDKVLSDILRYDRPEMLDLYIKRTGLGIDFEEAQKQSETPPVATAVNDKNKIYLGLNVHGKKRADLANQNDPNADPHQTQVTEYQPIVWRAAQEGAVKIVRYLASEQPLASYRRFASSHTDERAVWLSRVGDLEKRLPVWLGWTTSSLGESPLTAAMVGKKDGFEIVKMLFETAPEVMAMAVKQRIKGVEFNTLMLALWREASVELIDFLLAKEISPAERDKRGWNIYHLLAFKGCAQLFKHLLQKLPRDVNEALLLQQTTQKLSTPLHLAIYQNCSAIVKLILEFSASSILIRDIDGSTTLHTAVRKQNPKTFRLLCQSLSSSQVPSTSGGSPTSLASALQIEDSVGNTPIDIITPPSLSHLLTEFWTAVREDPTSLTANDVEAASASRSSMGFRYDREDVKRVESELGYLKDVVKGLMDGERKKRRTKIVWELNTFAAMLEARVVNAKEGWKENNDGDEDKDGDEDEDNGADPRGTLIAVREALAKASATPEKRRLVHVADVQRSVGGDLKAARKAKETEELALSSNQGLHEEGEAEADEPVDEEKKTEEDLRRSMVGSYLNLDGMRDAEN